MKKEETNSSSTHRKKPYIHISECFSGGGGGEIPPKIPPKLPKTPPKSPTLLALPSSPLLLSPETNEEEIYIFCDTNLEFVNPEKTTTKRTNTKDDSSVNYIDPRNLNLPKNIFPRPNSAPTMPTQNTVG